MPQLLTIILYRKDRPPVQYHYQPEIFDWYKDVISFEIRVGHTDRVQCAGCRHGQ